ncbi:C6 transcription factor [Paraphaeosphaeria minitans]|uniref:C6 transcription factor n=1 Tax=Paraphaeosphaeria minitans TaxID=565426 RepID=A0A9P6KPP3_9PLEO|nr:C6 transcription factor [Paraphaeosphaeria minitans]
MEAASNFPAIPDTEAKERLFQCSTCKRSFIRVDHLMRHVRSHTKQRPYVCPTCSKCFARVDLLKRHVANHASDTGKKRSRRDISRMSRVGQACEECSKSHLKCEDEKPCRRCRQKNLTCCLSTAAQEELDAAQELGAAQDLLDLSNDLESRSPHPHATQQTPSQHHSESTVDEAIMVAQQKVPQAWDNMQGMEPNFTDVVLGASQEPESLPMFMQNPAMSYSEGSPGDAFIPDFLRYMPPVETSLSGYATPRGLAEHNFNWDIDFSGIDLALFDQSLMHESVQHDSFRHDGPPVAPAAAATTSDQHLQNGTADSAAADRAKAFDRSLWRYMPRSKTNPVTAGESNLAFAGGESEGQSPALIPPRNITSERLSYTTRDRFLALVIEGSSKENSKRIASGFPSLGLLDGMIQIFFTSPSVNAGSCFHLPTFSSAKIKPLLLVCVVAAGAFSAPDELLRKLGQALHEVARVSMAKSIDEDNSNIRDIQYLQMQLLLCEIGMWSGVSRKMEISESFLQPPVTMLRRGGWFSRSVWKKIYPTPDDEGPVLQKKWKEWVLQESWLRLVYRYFEFDRQSSMALLKPPLISYAEMNLPLPHSDALWQAPSAPAWKTTYLTTLGTTARRPTLFDCLEDLEYLNLFPTASSAHLYMIWGMIWEYRQLCSLGSKKRITNDLLLNSRQAELTKMCEEFRLNHVSGSIQELLIVETMLMHLNAPVEEVQTFAGIAGLDEARHAYTSIRNWTSTESARQAVWHASQVVKISETASQGVLQNFYAMAVYHAALVLWAYGLLKRTADDANNEPNREPPVFILGTTEERDVKNFVKFNRGEPAIRDDSTQTVAHLHNAAQVLGTVSQILLRNHGSVRGSCPPLVEGLVQLMEVLRSASK